MAIPAEDRILRREVHQSFEYIRFLFTASIINFELCEPGTLIHIIVFLDVDGIDDVFLYHVGHARMQTHPYKKLYHRKGGVFRMFSWPSTGVSVSLAELSLS
jgi:hypothetical protein